MFKNDERDFVPWWRKVVMYITGIYPELEPVLTWASECTEIAGREMLMDQLGDDTGIERIEKID
eukprot:2998302-Heterocapsa_arctica.AAC.1